MTTPESTVDAAMASSSLARHGTFSALRHRNYRLFWYGNSISFIGDWLDQVALN